MTPSAVMIPAMGTDPFALEHYTVRRQLLKILGAGFHIYDGDQIVAYSRQKAFRLREDIRLFEGDGHGGRELLTVHARSVIDFSAAYDVLDAVHGEKVGAARRRGFSSMVRDSWEILDADDQPIGQLQEDSAGMAMLRRFINIIPQTFHLDGPGGRAVFKQRFNPFVYKLDVAIDPGCGLDRRLILAVAILIAAIEGRQE